MVSENANEIKVPEKPFKCSYEGCDFSAENERALKMHTLGKHIRSGGAKKFVPPAPDPWNVLDSMLDKRIKVLQKRLLIAEFTKEIKELENPQSFIQQMQPLPMPEPKQHGDDALNMLDRILSIQQKLQPPEVEYDEPEPREEFGINEILELAKGFKPNDKKPADNSDPQSGTQ